jgi:hypothetical protein
MVDLSGAPCRGAIGFVLSARRLRFACAPANIRQPSGLGFRRAPKIDHALRHATWASVTLDPIIRMVASSLPPFAAFAYFVRDVLAGVWPYF